MGKYYIMPQFSENAMKRFFQITRMDGQSARLLKYVALVEGGLLLLA